MVHSLLIELGEIREKLKVEEIQIRESGERGEGLNELEKNEL